MCMNVVCMNLYMYACNTHTHTTQGSKNEELEEQRATRMNMWREASRERELERHSGSGRSSAKHSSASSSSSSSITSCTLTTSATRRLALTGQGPASKTGVNRNLKGRKGKVSERAPAGHGVIRRSNVATRLLISSVCVFACVWTTCVLFCLVD